MVKGTTAQILNGYKLNINRKTKQAEEYMEKFEQNFTPLIDTKISHMITDLRDQIGRMEKRYYEDISIRGRGICYKS